MTSRAEYRLLLRQDNADQRLTEKSYLIGLATEERYQRALAKKTNVQAEKERLACTYVERDRASEFLLGHGTTGTEGRISLLEMLKRPQISYDDLMEVDGPDRPALSYHERTELEVEIKYEGYISKQLKQIERFKKLENKALPEDLEYESIEGLRIEARQKLSKVRPLSIGQASRISGVSPADVSVLMVYLEKKRRERSGNR